MPSQVTLNPTTSLRNGAVQRWNVNQTWADIRTGDGNGTDEGTNESHAVYIQAANVVTVGNFKALYRGALGFNTNFGAGVTVISAVLSLYGSGKNDFLSCTPDVNVYECSPNGDINITSTMYQGAGIIALSSTKTYASWSVTGYNNFTLNAAGLAAINKTGFTWFTLRNVNYDVDAVIPAWIQNQFSELRYWTTVKGANYQPELVVTYTTDPIKILELAFNQSIFTEAPTWTDVSSDLMKLNVKRGRMHELDKVEAGTATFTLDNSDGNWWRNNTASTFYVAAGAECVKPLTLIRYSATYDGTTYRRFYGVVESFRHSWLGEKGYNPVVELNCVDLFKSLQRCKLQALTSTTGAHTNVGVIDDDVGASGQAGQKIIVLDNIDDINRLYAGQSLLIGDDAGGGTYEYNYIASINYNTLTLTMAVNLANTYTEGNNAYVKKFQLTTSAVRIDDILYEWGWPQSLRDIDIGGITVSRLVPPTGGTGALEHLLDVVEAESGLFFFAKDGKATFQNNTYRQALTSSATYTDSGSDSSYVEPELIDDDTLIYNEAHIAGDDITEQIVVNLTSQAEQGARAIVRTESLIFYDADAWDQAYNLVARFSDSFLRCADLLIYPDADPTVLYPQVLAYDISTRITFELDNMTENPAEISRDYHIEGIEEAWSREEDLYQITWQLWDINQYQIVRAEHDGHIYGENAVYAVTHDLAVGTVQNDVGVVAVGQQNLGVGIADDFWIFRGFLQFDTTGIIAADVLSATILVKVYGYYVVDNQFYVIIVDPSTLVNPLVVTDYATLHGSTSAWGTSTLITTPDINTSFLQISLTQDAIDTINVAGTTKFGLRSNRDISATSPGTPGLKYEYISFYGVGSTFVPRLIVTYHQAT
jgi:hypothetical protein